MTNDEDAGEPDWETPLSLSTTPALLIHALMGSASAVHTGWASCVDETLALSNVLAMDDSAGNYVRLVEQEFVEDGKPDQVWHDWTLEVRIGSVLTTGHWQLEAGAHPSDWDWNAREARRAFERACVLIGRRVRETLAVEEPERADPIPRASRH
ncbi:hypothetical protein [Candidatus Thiodictyon syntrophicum]|jgi:hypothetical protein|uniref:Uncharacterized protein n=1 Tax=Candidatus Thiodictyon syntrophicum TaxID=1166950 RepID=A0A2K8UFV9_9GAMM|nr:hypothetical protein [Candidatus Thiodictyon syntrophicum]AUB84011.1 hypothetical protein THSYN_25805 [Candidatus Thiodictyon syntrophicum]